MPYSFEMGPIRPPSEAYSLLIRVTRNCSWNRCKFCRTYKGERFELRQVEEIKRDIDAARAIQGRIEDSSSAYGGNMKAAAAAMLNNTTDAAVHNVALWLYAGGESAFLQDANTLIMRTGELAEVIRYLKRTFPSIKRVTSYARSKTAAKKKLEELVELREAGLSRLHIGMESGYDPLLEFMDKGATAEVHIAGGRKVVESGISLSEYVVLGLGGRKMWREHATETARVLNEVDPDFIRVRTLTVTRQMSLYDDVENGSFVRLADEEILEEERLLIENLECHSNFVSDHITNLLQEVEGKLPDDKGKMLAIIDKFRSLSPQERLNFKIGRRTGVYTGLADMDDSRKHEVAERVIERLRRDGGEADEKAIIQLMERFI